MNRPVQSKKSSILDLQEKMLEQPQIDIPVKHYFANGFYAREMTMPAGSMVVGAVHLSEHLCIISKGDVSIESDELSGYFQAPYTYVSKPGAKRAIYAHSELVWTTVHMTEETDIKVLEQELVQGMAPALDADKKQRLEDSE